MKLDDALNKHNSYHTLKTRARKCKAKEKESWGVKERKKERKKNQKARANTTCDARTNHPCIKKNSDHKKQIIWQDRGITIEMQCTNISTKQCAEETKIMNSQTSMKPRLTWKMFCERKRKKFDHYFTNNTRGDWTVMWRLPKKSIDKVLIGKRTLAWRTTGRRRHSNDPSRDDNIYDPLPVSFFSLFFLWGPSHIHRIMALNYYPSGITHHHPPAF